MNKIYVDGSYNATHRIGAFCVVVAVDDQKPSYDCAIAENATGANSVETEGLVFAIKFGKQLQERNGKPVTIFSDSLTAIRACKDEAAACNIELQHISGHLLGKIEVEVTDDIKRHHWADVMAGQAVAGEIRHLTNNHERETI